MSTNGIENAGTEADLKRLREESAAGQFLSELRFLLEGRTLDITGEIAMYRKDQDSPGPVYRDHDTLIVCARSRLSEAETNLSRVNRLALKHGLT